MKKYIRNFLDTSFKKLVKQANTYVKLKKQVKDRFIVIDKYRYLIDASETKEEIKQDNRIQNDASKNPKTRIIARVKKNTPKITEESERPYSQNHENTNSTTQRDNTGSAFPSCINESFFNSETFFNTKPYLKNQSKHCFKFVTKKEVNNVLPDKEQFYFN